MHPPVLASFTDNLRAPLGFPALRFPSIQLLKIIFIFEMWQKRKNVRGKHWRLRHLFMSLQMPNRLRRNRIYRPAKEQ